MPDPKRVADLPEDSFGFGLAGCWKAISRCRAGYTVSAHSLLTILHFPVTIPPYSRQYTVSLYHAMAETYCFAILCYTKLYSILYTILDSTRLDYLQTNFH